uniref:UDP-glucuronosyltransferase n=1 Tax=Photinus pyralis TaxID=7054 RepID=A0A1Y1N9C1_PHOPY
MLFNAFLILIFIHNEARSARILGIFHERSFSHQILGIKLLSALAANDHDVTMLTPVAPKEVNFTVIKLNMEGHDTASMRNLYDTHTFTIWRRMVGTDDSGLLWAETVLNDSNLKRLLKSKQQFDLVLMEQLGNHALKGICYHYKAICVILSTMGPTWLTNEMTRNPNAPSHMPDMYVNYPPVMGFFQRLHNAYAQYLQKLYFYTYTIRKHNEIVQKHFPGFPHIMEILYNVSLVLVNSHVSTSNPASNLPNVVEVGGFHLDLPKKLPEHIDAFLNGGDNGAVYFSMGSILNARDMEKHKLEMIITVLGQLKQRVLWVGNVENHSQLPENILSVKWAPQVDVLAHPNIRLFISHGGLLSLTESVACGVPILGIPVHADQGYNSALSEAAGFGISLPYQSLTAEKFKGAVHQLLQNRSYTENAKQRSRVFHDRPMKPLDLAVYWIQYVIRHNGAMHLRSSALHLAWYQYSLLDVLFVVVLLVAVICLLTKKMFNLCLRKQLKPKTNKIKKAQ